MKLVEMLILSLGNVRSQCQQHPITVIKIKGHIKDLEIIRTGCGGSQTISFDTDDKPTEAKPDSKPSDDPVPDAGGESAGEAEEEVE